MLQHSCSGDKEFGVFEGAEKTWRREVGILIAYKIINSHFLTF